MTGGATATGGATTGGATAPSLPGAAEPDAPAASGGASVVASQWSYRYPGRAQPALADVSFSVRPGTLVVLMGASGSGKSTLLAALAGTLPEGGTSGRLVVEGADGGGHPGVGLVQQEPEANVVMERVGDDVAFPLENRAVPRPAIWPRVDAALGSVGLVLGREAPTGRLSGGQQQLLAVAAAAVAEPGLLLLDEPTANLDPASANAVVRAVDAVRRQTGCTVVVVEHRVEPWLVRASLVLLASAGTVVPVAPGALHAHLAADPEAAGRVWLDHHHLPARPPRTAAGAEVLVAQGLRVVGRLAGTDLVIRSGEVLALTGPPGSGKSTLLDCLGGLLAPTDGTVLVRCGHEEAWRADPWTWPSGDVAATFGIVFQNPEHQFVTGRVADELRHGLGRSGARPAGADDGAAPHGQGDAPGSSGGAARVAALLERLHLAHLRGVDPFTLSGGEQRRLSVGTALVRDPGLLLLDEPTFGQDPATWAEVVDIIAAHRDAGGAVVLATHDPHLVTALGAREVPLTAPAERLPASPQPPAPTSISAPAPFPARTSSPASDSIQVLAQEPAQDLDRTRDGGSGLGWDPVGGAEGARGLRRLDPLALLGAAVLASVAGLVSTAVAMNLAIAALVAVAAVLGRLGLRRLVLLAAPALLASASVAWSNALLSDAGLSSRAAWAAAALPASRVLAVALPGLVAAVALDPTRLADALVARLRVPARAAYAVLAGLRLLPLLADDWGTLERATRARGLGGRGLRARARQFGSITFRLLVAALRRAGRLAVALDVRGLRSDVPRTIARPVRWRWPDVTALALGVLALAGALVTR
jgi:energy-coupling factor transport system ATP-binding protein